MPWQPLKPLGEAGLGSLTFSYVSRRVSIRLQFLFLFFCSDVLRKSASHTHIFCSSSSNKQMPAVASISCHLLKPRIILPVQSCTLWPFSWNLFWRSVRDGSLLHSVIVFWGLAAVCRYVKLLSQARFFCACPQCLSAIIINRFFVHFHASLWCCNNGWNFVFPFELSMFDFNFCCLRTRRYKQRANYTLTIDGGLLFLNNVV